MCCLSDKLDAAAAAAATTQVDCRRSLTDISHTVSISVEIISVHQAGRVHRSAEKDRPSGVNDVY